MNLLQTLEAEQQAKLAKARPVPQFEPGDTLRVECEILAISPSRSKPNQGIVTVRCTTFNQNREPVFLFTAKVLVFKRP